MKKLIFLILSVFIIVGCDSNNQPQKTIVSIERPITLDKTCGFKDTQNKLHYYNCSAGQLLDICNNIAYWKRQIDCCDKNSEYIIITEAVNSNAKTKEFYKDYMNKFNLQSYHCALKAGKINN